MPVSAETQGIKVPRRRIENVIVYRGNDLQVFGIAIYRIEKIGDIHGSPHRVQILGHPCFLRRGDYLFRHGGTFLGVHPDQADRANPVAIASRSESGIRAGAPNGKVNFFVAVKIADGCKYRRIGHGDGGRSESARAVV